MEYQKQLLKRLLQMIEDNEKQEKEYDKVEEKLNVSYWDNREEWNKRYNALTPKQKEIYNKGRIIYCKSAFKRLRIELNKSMLELMVFMEEKERYELNDNDCIIDNEKDVVICDVCDVNESSKTLVDLLNQQDKHIKELELLLKADNKMKTNSLNGFEKLRQEKQQLREDLQAKDILVNTYMSVVGTLDNAKQLKQSQQQLAIEELEKLREYIVLNDEYDEEIGCNIIKTFGLIEDLADKIKSLKGEE